MERAVVEGALEAARKDNSRLQSEVAALRSTLRRGAPLVEETLRGGRRTCRERHVGESKGQKFRSSIDLWRRII